MVDLQWNHFGPIPPTKLNAAASAERFYLDLKEAFPGYVADFEQKFADWQGKWFSQEMSGSSSAHARCELPEYDPVLLLGPKIIPLVVYKLSNPQNVFATALYNHLEADKESKVDREDTLNYLTLNRHANLIVELNHERAQRARARIEAWKQTHGASSADVDSSASGEEYHALVQMGPGITAHVMLEYSKDQTGPWFKLMHELVCEKPMDVGESIGGGGAQYERWRDWFEHREYHEAAEGLMPSYLDNLGF